MGLRDLVWLRRMTLTLSEWHEVKVDEDLCVGPALNSTRVSFSKKDHNLRIAAMLTMNILQSSLHHPRAAYFLYYLFPSAEKYALH